MRISDWSSDVCSSDLLRDTKLSIDLVDVAAGISSTLSNFNVDRETRFGFAEISLPILSPANNISFAERLILTEIGRASCRERVCQYVSISVVAGYLKKKNKQT